MCLAIPAKVVEINGPEAVAEFSGVRRKIRLDLVDNCSIGDYVLIHAGFAINILDEQSAKESLKLWQELESFLENAENAPEE